MDKTIIEDAKAAGAIEIDYTGGYESDWTFTTQQLAKFIELQAIRQSSQSEPVEPSGGLYIVTNGQKRLLKKASPTAPIERDK